MRGRGRAWALGLAALLAAGCGTAGAPQYGGNPPNPAAAFGECSFCHTDDVSKDHNQIANILFAAGGHPDLSMTCTDCHDQNLRPNEFGPGHRNVPACADCHATQMTHHDPQAGTPQACLACHDPHGNRSLLDGAPANILFIRGQIVIPTGETRPIVFTNLKGKADGSFASVSNPGSGICEVCHIPVVDPDTGEIRPRHYRSDGTGEPHFAFPCFTCHPHSSGFEPQ